MRHTLTLLDHLLTSLLFATDLDPVTREVALDHVSRVVAESKALVEDDPLVNVAVLVRCMLLLTQLQGLLWERADYPTLIQDVESQIAAEQIYQQVCL